MKNHAAQFLSPAASGRLAAWRDGGFLPDWAMAALDELIEAQAWDELEDRFFCDLSFGTGGMRGRVIGRRPAPSELGPGGADAPLHPAIGANTMNDFTVARATMGLYRQVAHRPGAKLAVSHDVRHFSRRFAELTARVWRRLGGEAWLFAGPRSTPQLSFSVRALGADAGVMITASHNPPHDNGYKVYNHSGGQLVPPQADQVVEAARAVAWVELGKLLAPQLAGARVIAGWTNISPALEEQYCAAVAQVALDPELIRRESPRIAFSALHGTGGVVAPDLLRQLGAVVSEVEAQAVQDARFPTVSSPNPEDLNALREVNKLASEINADLALATDPDADRIGTAFRISATEREELTGNELGVLLADYRLTRAKELGYLPPEGSPQAAILKTFVTTPLLEAVARGHGVRYVNTLTGFKWIGEKLRRYEETLMSALALADGEDKPRPEDFGALPPRERAALRLQHSTWVVFAAEESYGCLAGDAARDKDANAAAVMCTELAAWFRAQGITARVALNNLYSKHGFHKEALRTLTFEGAAGAVKIRRILSSLRATPPALLGGQQVADVSDFLHDERKDEDGEMVPREDFLLYELAGGWRCAVRGSGTEPKLKLYFFVREPAAPIAALEEFRAKTELRANAWVENVMAEMHIRAEH